jgi:hypothetical protein
MRARAQASLPALCASLGAWLFPRVALAHGEGLIVQAGILLWVVAAVPWAGVVYLVARKDVDREIRRNNLGPLTSLMTVVAAVAGIAMADRTIHNPETSLPFVLSPLVLAVSALPAMWYLWRQRSYDLAIAILLVPLIATGTCVVGPRIAP